MPPAAPRGMETEYSSPCMPPVVYKAYSLQLFSEQKRYKEVSFHGGTERGYS